MFGIIIKNITGRKWRSTALIFLTAVLSLAIFAGTVTVQALRNGFANLENRLGADIMVVPYEAITKSSLDDILLQGNTGYFYMDSKYLEELSQIEGVGQISAQYYLASVKAGCCSLPVEIIGYDPETDFAITPWIKKSSGEEIGYLDVVVGNDLNAFVGDTIQFFDTDVHVAAKLEKTGTSYDTQVFATRETVQTLIEASLNKQLNEYNNINSGNIVSCILINVADGYDVEDILNEINVHNNDIEAVRTTNMITGISDSMVGVSKITGVLIVAVWILALGILIAAFLMVTGERKKEFAVLRAMGASRKKLFSMVLSEGMMLSLIGGVVGVGIGIVIMIPFSGLIEAELGLPFLLPSVVTIVAVSLLAIALTLVSGALTAALSASRIARIDTGSILRSGE